jgi:drug/metabolite transporter (DMT)-like permease
MTLSARDVRKSLVSGVFLAFHFLSWITSLRYTSVASSVVLVSCHTLIIVMWAKLTAGKTFSRRAMAGVTIALLGTALIGVKGWNAGSQELLGDALAFLGAIFMAGYCIVGQDVRQRVGVLSYTTVVYGTAAVVLFGACLALSVPLWPYPPREWRIFWLLAIIPTVFGHTMFNWALKYVPAWAVSAAILGEPVGAAILAFAVLGESPGTIVILGGIMVIAGLYTFLVNDTATSIQ